MSLLLAESGSTKTDWCLLRKGSKPLRHKTQGLNPYLQSGDDMLGVLKKELHKWPATGQPKCIAFYGAGLGTAQRKKELKNILKKHFGVKQIDVQSDLVAAARGLCGNDKGIVCILGTGSNSCYYNGEKIKDRQVSLGYIAGDEGSGNHMGKRVLQYYAYNTFDAELKMGFEQLFGSNVGDILHQLYREPFPNRYLATFVQLLVANRGHYMVENIIEDCLNDFFQHHILKYRQSFRYSINFTGSVAYAFSDVIRALCDQYELEPGAIEKSPLEGLIRYHKQ
ncbi:MAG: N-acetylglucosamine kinase [Bacteroidetes bacterium]|nr:N-acetylglucosamine kinase [Bacteroidota bacterium]